MNSHKHTPGPWKINNLTSVCSAVGADSGDGCAADQYDCWQIAECGAGQTLVDGQMTSLGFDVVKANTLLIAAAPDLLAALIEARKMLEQNLPTIERNVGFCPNIVWSTVLASEVARAAIAKAKGTQQ